ncbi:Uncharacterised protein [Mycobacterium tuberculosis]|nr:Uncharacterised protein [Mycobacterium tuberculosis]
MVHRAAAHTSAALTNPLIKALIGNGAEPIYQGISRAPASADTTPSTVNRARTTKRIARSVAPVVRLARCRSERVSTR